MNSDQRVAITATLFLWLLRIFVAGGSVMELHRRAVAGACRKEL